MSVYMIKPKNLDEPIYIGSTKRTINKRYSEHKNEYYQYKNEKRRKIMVYDVFDTYGIDNCECIAIETDIDFLLLKQREAHHIKMLNCVNKTLPFETQENQQEKLKETRRTYRNNNWARCLKMSNVWRENNREKVNARSRELRQLKKSIEIL